MVAGRTWSVVLTLEVVLQKAVVRTSVADLSYVAVVIDRKQIFGFRPKTNIRQENAAEYSTDNEYSAQGSKHYKKSQICIRKKKNPRMAVASSS
jgi:hypothetical protein